jgi:hypothetical protein
MLEVPLVEVEENTAFVSQHLFCCVLVKHYLKKCSLIPYTRTYSDTQNIIFFIKGLILSLAYIYFQLMHARSSCVIRVLLK